MGRNGSGDAGGGGGRNGHKGGGGNKAPGTWTPQGPGGWTRQPHTQPGGWGQPTPGWPQHPKTTNWAPQAHAWGRPTHTWTQPGPYRKGLPGVSRSPQHGGRYSGPEPRGRRGGHGVWQGIQDVTAAARVALDTARELHSLGALAPAPVSGQAPVTDSDGAGRGWLATARGWLLGDLPSQQLLPKSTKSTPPHTRGPAPRR